MPKEYINVKDVITMLADFILRLVVAGLLGAIIGLDREIRAKEAGFGHISWFL